MSGLFGNPSSGGGLFGGGQKTGGLFGGGAKPGGLFGSSTTPSASGGGLFGQSNPTQGQPQTSGGGMFGSSASSGGGLFGGASSGPKPGGMFGGSATQTSGGGMFGSSSTGTGAFGGGTSGGLFGSSTSGTSSAFGASSGGGGIFGSKATTGTSGGLFGSKAPTTSGGGLFGGSNKSSFFGGGNTSSSTVGGMFGQSAGGATQGSANLQNGTSSIYFNGMKDRDHGGDSKNFINLNTFTAESSLAVHSLEEWRMADYALKKLNKIDFPIGAQPKQQQSTSTSAFGGGSFGSSSTPAFGASKPSGGLFGSSTASGSKPGGLFGSSTTTAAPATGGLFGSSTSKPAGGLFGGGAAKPGGIGTLQRSNASSSLFGSKPAGQTSGGLFGGSSGQTSGGLFGGSSGQTSGGLFGSSTTQSTSTFGQKPAGSSLFGGSSTSSGGLFGSTAAKPTFGTSGGSTGLFGSQTPKPAGSLFGTSQQTAAAPTGSFAPQPIDMNYQLAYSAMSKDPYGLSDIESIFKIKSIDADKQVVLSKLVEEVLSLGTKEKYTEDLDMPTHIPSLAKMPIKLKLGRRDRDDDRYYSTQNDLVQRRGYNASIRTDMNRFKDDEHRARDIDYNRLRRINDDDYSVGQKYAEERRKLRATAKLLETDNFSSGSYGNQIESETQHNFTERVFERPTSQGDLTGPNIIRVKVSVFVEDSEKLLVLSIDKTRKVRELVNQVVKKLRAEFPNIQESLIQVAHRSRILNQENTFAESGVESGMRFDVLVQEPITSSTTPTITPNYITVTSSVKKETPVVKSYASEEHLPIQTNKEYVLSPSLVKMARMSEDELATIQNLTIQNQHGKIVWDGETDVRGINFDVLVKLEHCAATVYPHEVEEQGLKPEVGKGLNKPSLIELYNVRPITKVTESKKRMFIQGLREKAASMDGAQFIDYDEDAGTLKIRVQHYTKYSFMNIKVDEDQSEHNEEQADHEEQNAALTETAKKSDEDNRFSFGVSDQKYLKGVHASGSSSEAELREPSSMRVSRGNDMEVDTHERYAINKLSYLDGIKEESDSRPSSMLEKSDHIDEEYDGPTKNKRTIQFSDQLEKEFDDGQYHDSQEIEEEEDEFSDERAGYVPTLDEIRKVIAKQKEDIRQHFARRDLDGAGKNRQPNKVHITRISKNSGPRNYILRKCNGYLGIEAPLNTQEITRILTPYSHRQHQERKDQGLDEIAQREEETKEFYISLLEAHRTFSNIIGNKHGIPALPIIEPPSTSSKLTKMWFSMVSHLKNTHITGNGELREIIDKECQMLTLFNACFGNSFIDLAAYMNNPKTVTRAMLDKYSDKKDELEERRRNKTISNWIKYATRNEIADRIVQDKPNMYEKVMLYLYCGNKHMAANLLLDHSKHNLALMVSQSEATNGTKSGIIDQHLEDHVNEDVKNIIAMIQGDYAYNDVLSWKCNLGRILWYYERSIVEALLKLKQNDSIEKEIHRNDPLAYAILSMYAKNQLDASLLCLERVVDHQNNLVRRTTWEAITMLRALKVLYLGDIIEVDGKNEKIDFEEYYTKLTYEYAYELESIGLWQWAVFVVLHLENNDHKTRYVKNALLKHVGNPNSQELTDFLIRDCGVPDHYVHEARAIWYESHNEHGKAFYEWIKSLSNPHNSNRAFECLIKNLSLSSESPELKFKDLDLVLKKLAETKSYISDWESQGKFLVKFVGLRNTTSKYFKDFYDEYGQFIKTSNQSILRKAENTVQEIVDTNTELIDLLDRFRIDKLSKSAKSLKVEIERMLLEWDTRLKVMEHRLNPDPRSIMLPQNRLIESCNLTANDKSVALDRISYALI